MIDRLNTWTGELYLRATSLSLRRQEGQTMAEYALILAVISIVTVGVLSLMGGAIKDKFQTICNEIKDGTCAATP